jgi:hypothetical protein
MYVLRRNEIVISLRTYIVAIVLDSKYVVCYDAISGEITSDVSTVAVLLYVTAHVFLSFSLPLRR